MLRFGLRSTSDDQLGWSMDSNPICHPSPAKKWIAQFGITLNFWWSAGLVDGLKPHPPSLFSQKMKCSVWDYIQLLIIDWTGGWTQTPSNTPLQPWNWNTHFWIMLTSDDQLGWLMELNPISHPLQPKKWNAHFWIMFNFWWLAGLVNGLEPHLPPLSSKKSEMLIFGLHSTSDDQLGWSMESNPICHPSPAKKIKCSFLDYIQLLLLARLVNGLEPYLPPLSSQKNEMLIFGLHSTSDDQLGWSMDSNPICHLAPAK